MSETVKNPVAKQFRCAKCLGVAEYDGTVEHAEAAKRAGALLDGDMFWCSKACMPGAAAHPLPARVETES